MKFLKTMYSTLILFVNTVFWAVTTAIISFTPWNHRYARIAGIWWGRLNLIPNGVRVHVSGTEHIDSSKTYMLLANHRSFVDVYTLYGYCGLNLRYVAKKELGNIPLFGNAMRRIGTIIVDRSNTAEAIGEMNRVGDELKANGVSIATFTEGTRQDKELLTPFKKGGFMLALRLGIDIAPVVMWGTDLIQKKGDPCIHAGVVQLRFLPTIKISDYSVETVGELMERARSAMFAEIEKLAKEYPAS